MYVEHINLKRSFAFCRVWGSHEEHDLHVHDCLEIGVVVKNELEYRFTGNTYHGRPGDVFLCRPFEPHWSFASPGQPFECILILFTPSALRNIPEGNLLLKPFYTVQGVKPFIPAYSRYAKAIGQAAILAMEAKEQGIEAWKTRQYMHFIHILLQVNESVRDSQTADDLNLGHHKIADVVGYLINHYQKPVDLDSLAREAGMGRTKFFKEFRWLTGLSPTEFLNRLRIQSAMDSLLGSKNESMIDLAYANGFQSLSTFNKQFKKFAGVSPREYRKNSK